MNYLRSRLLAYFLRSFQKDLKALTGNIDKKEQDILLSGLFQNKGFLGYINARQVLIIQAMANENKKPSDSLYTELYGRRLELLDLLTSAKIAYNKRQRELAKDQKDKHSDSPQAPA